MAFTPDQIRALRFSELSRYFAEAVARGIGIIGFPEMSITDYVDPTRCPEAILHLDGPEVTQVLKLRAQTATQIVAELEVFMLYRRQVERRLE